MLGVRLLRGAVLRRPVTCTFSVHHSTASPDSNQAALEDMPQQMENPFKEPPQRCILCGIPVDYKNTQLLSQFVSPHTGRIYGRHITGLCKMKINVVRFPEEMSGATKDQDNQGLCGLKQKAVAKSIKRATIMGFMPDTYKDPAYLKDPKICDV